MANSMFSETLQPLPNQTISRPVPVFSFPKKNDVYLRLWDKCPRIDDKIVKSWNDPIWKAKEKSWGPFVTETANLVG